MSGIHSLCHTVSGCGVSCSVLYVRHGMYVSARVSLPLPHVDQWMCPARISAHTVAAVLKGVAQDEACVSCLPTTCVSIPSCLGLVARALARVAVLCGGAFVGEKFDSILTKACATTARQRGA